MVGALARLVGSVLFLVLVYLVCGAVLGLYGRTQSLIALAGVPLILAAALVTGARFYKLQVGCQGNSACLWPTLFGVFALASVLGFTVVWEVLIGVRLKTIVPSTLDGASAIAYGLALSALAAVSEEVAFRGIMQSWLRERRALSGQSASPASCSVPGTWAIRSSQRCFCITS